MNDGYSGTHSTAARLDKLKAYQDAWDHLRWSPDPLSFPVSAIRLWELIGGVLALYDAVNNFIHIVQFPSAYRGIEHREWKIHDIDIPHGDFTMDPSSDLLVILTRDSVRNEGTHFKILLRSLETGKQHPKAKHPEISLLVSSDTDMWMFEMRVSDQHIGIMFEPDVEDTELFIWDWHTGIMEKKFAHVQSYAFLTNNLILLGSLSRDEDVFLAELVVIDLHNEQVNDPGFSFHLPDAASEYDVHGFDIMSGPAATSDTWCSESNAPFTTSLQDRLMVVNYHIRDPHGEHRTYAVFVPLSVLLHHIRHRRTNQAFLTWNEWGPRGTRMLRVEFSQVWITYIHGMKASVYDSTSMGFRLFDFSKLGLMYDLKKGEKRPSTQYLTEPTVIESVFGEMPIRTYLPGRIRSGGIPLKSFEAVMVTEDALVAVTDGDEAALHVYSF
ncbi:hypothetical protein GYMLUDRAFT_38750 [Collybiopsis luxurians FD-317 M1]|nr:hypothetical protein GYMLUDRAFT_38750 [Collybiopsis luxurians FD-317 M1]